MRGTSGPPAPRAAQWRSVTRPISAHPEALHMQMQGYAVVTAANARGNDQIGERPGQPDEVPGHHDQALPLGTNADKTTASPAPGCSSIPLRSSGFAPSTGEPGHQAARAVPVT